MTLLPGARLGPYEIVGAIGAGGMGEVFRARDTKLNRDVAIKVLPSAFADDPERLARFTREAQTLASLNHPYIATIHGIEEVPAVSGSSGPGSRALVMELVEGEDLSVHIARGPVPIAEALPIARQIAEALEAAHEQGIVHRDLKPANIKVRTDGTVKVLDFGLAKAMDGGGATNSALSQSPTMSRHMTEMGMIIGTAAYMSPEQAKGKTVDRRTDIWAFGVVLYEMLSGQRAFKGEDVSETLASVLKDKLSMDALPADTPPRLKRLIERCLDRDLKTRLRDIGEARVKLGRIEAGETDIATSAPGTVAAAIIPASRRALPWALLAVTLVALIGAVVAWAPWRPTAEAPQTRFFVSPPDGWRVTATGGLGGVPSAPLAVSPDGSRIAFLANAATGRSRLWVRALDTLIAQELPGTDGALSPFWSPDSRFLAFFADGKLKKIDVTGGPAVTLCDVGPDPTGGTWSLDGVIVFGPTNRSALQKVSASGGVPSAATVLGEGEDFHARPSFLPDSRHFIYRAGNASTVGIGAHYVAALDSTARTLLTKDPISTRVIYSRGHLLFVREATLMAQPFDLGRLTLTGEPVPIADQISTGSTSASDTGVLVYQSGIATAVTTQLTWFDRAGKLLGLVEKPGAYNTVALSPDDTRVAVSRIDSQAAPGMGPAQTGNSDLWVHEFARSTSTRLTFDPAQDWMAAWSPDGSRIAWSTNRDGNHNLYQKLANGAGTDEALLKSSDTKYTYDWSQDGRFLLYAVVAGGKVDLWVLPLTGDDRKPALYLQQTGFNVSQARFSPDSRFVAYTSNASGSFEVYVQPFPAAAGGKWMVSQGGGNQPRWRRDGKELFYISADSRMMAVPVATTPAFTPGVPKALFAAPIWGGGTLNNVTRYDVTALGQKFLINALPPDAAAAPPAPITVVLNWDRAVKK